MPATAVSHALRQKTKRLRLLGLEGMPGCPRNSLIGILDLAQATSRRKLIARRGTPVSKHSYNFLTCSTICGAT
jgi:hypothetical protein